ncbi:MAG: vitamin K epoxide reductase family protein [Parcubacteria group bacterium]|nr:vitamin K epoxide reductase family protein [Parcubacteria group bacterium]
MQFTVTFIILTITGIIDVGYLVYKRYAKDAQPLICPLDHDCGKVLESKWAKMFGIRNEILGLVFYGVILLVVLANLFSLLFIPLLYITLFVSIGLLFSLFLAAIEIFAIHDYCFYCVLSAVITLLLFINSFFLS